jgi:hypothetical protein
MSNLARCGSARIPNCSPFTHFYTFVRVEEVLRGSRPSFVCGERADVEGADEGCECVGFSRAGFPCAAYRTRWSLFAVVGQGRICIRRPIWRQWLEVDERR